MVTTVLQLITDALVELGYLGADEPLDAADADLGARLFRSMYDRFQGTRLQLWTVTRTPYVLAIGQQTRTVGPTGTIAVAAQPRPLWIPWLGVTPVGDTVELEVVPYATREEWLAEPNKSLTLQYPLRYLYEPAVPNGILTFWPIPTTTATIILASPTPLGALPATISLLLITELTVPEGYDEAWRLQLARRFARPFGQPLTPDLAADAREALGVILRNNDPGPPPAAGDPALTGTGRFDILTGRTH